MCSLSGLKSKVLEKKLCLWKPGFTNNHWFMIVSKSLCLPQPRFSHPEAVYSQPLPPPHMCRGPQMQLWVGRHFLTIKEGGPQLVCYLLSRFLAHWMGHGRCPIKSRWMNGQSSCNCFHWAKVSQSRSFLNNSPLPSNPVVLRTRAWGGDHSICAGFTCDSEEEKQMPSSRRETPQGLWQRQTWLVSL